MARLRVLPPPPVEDSLRSKLDKLAIALADALLDPRVEISDKIAGLKALAAYRDNRRSGGVKSAFDGYRADIAEAAEENGDAA